MKYFIRLIAGLAVFISLTPAAMAQIGGAPGGQSSGPSVQPKARTPDFAPPALPGETGTPGIATAPKVAKANQGDPTVQLFTAINSNDYNSAQDALGRGADLTAQNTLGETPLDMSIALNENSITFMLLSARNEGGDNSAPQPAPGRQAASHAPAARHAAHVMPARLETPPPLASHVPAPGNDPGTPDPAAGFLGFGPKN